MGEGEPKATPTRLRGIPSKQPPLTSAERKIIPTITLTRCNARCNVRQKVKMMKLITGQTYHVLNKSIARFKIYNNRSEFYRMLERAIFYQKKTSERFANFEKRKNYKNELQEFANYDKSKIVEIIAYCFMPTHFHFILKQLKDNGISRYLNNTLNSYTHYFNNKYKRKGPLWQGRTKKILVESDEQLLHLTRYIHLNPTTSYLVDKPEDWTYSSYNEYINNSDVSIKICKYDDVLDINANEYKEFVEDIINYQRELGKIKRKLLE